MSHLILMPNHGVNFNMYKNYLIKIERLPSSV